jgi:hypothetical protein
MKYLLLLICGTAQAAPLCWPSLASPPVVGKASSGFYASWVCAPDQAYFYTFTASEALPWVTSVVNGVFDPVAANTASGSIAPLSSADLALFRAVQVNQGWNLPKTLTAIAYKQRQAVDGVTYVAIGSVPIGTPCTMQGQAGDYMMIPRASVKLASRFDTLPLTVWAKCG